MDQRDNERSADETGHGRPRLTGRLRLTYYEVVVGVYNLKGRHDSGGLTSRLANLTWEDSGARDLWFRKSGP